MSWSALVTHTSLSLQRWVCKLGQRCVYFSSGQCSRQLPLLFIVGGWIDGVCGGVTEEWGSLGGGRSAGRGGGSRPAGQIEDSHLLKGPQGSGGAPPFLLPEFFSSPCHLPRSFLLSPFLLIWFGGCRNVEGSGGGTMGDCAAPHTHSTKTWRQTSLHRTRHGTHTRADWASACLPLTTSC